MVILRAQFLSSGLPPPLANPTVEGAQLAILEFTRVAALQDEKERSGLQVWCLFQLLHDFRPYLGKVVGTRAPPTLAFVLVFLFSIQALRPVRFGLSCIPIWCGVVTGNLLLGRRRECP